MVREWSCGHRSHWSDQTAVVARPRGAGARPAQPWASWSPELWAPGSPANRRATCRQLAGSRLDGTPGLVGRAVELRSLTGAIEQARLVSVVGPCGVGKTRLAFEAVSAVAVRFGGGVTAVALQEVDGGRRLDHVVAGAFGLRAGADWRALLASRIGTARVLILLDGCEHVAADCRSLVEELVDACPNLRVLVTSRYPLGSKAERVLSLDGLGVPDDAACSMASLLCSDSARLLVESASASSSGLVLDGSEAEVRTICRALGGLPLALELVAPVAAAAGWSETAAALQLGVAEDRRAIRDPDLPPPVVAAIEWRLSRLDPVERRLVEVLSAFPAGAGLETLVSVAGAPELHRGEAAEALSRLTATAVVSSEVLDGVSRYFLRDVIRRHVRDILVGEGRFEAIGSRRLRFVLGKLAGGEEVLVSGPSQLSWMEALAREEGNWRAALDFALETGDSEAAALLCCELWRYFELSGQLVEGREVLSRVLEANPESPVLRARLLDGLGMLAWRHGDYVAADAALTKALELAHDGMSSRLSNHLGLVALFAGSSERARQHFERALADATNLDSPGEAALVQANLALLAVEDGRPLEAKTRAYAALALQLAVGDRHGQAVSRLHAGIALFYLGEHRSAVSEAGEAAAIFMEFGDARNLAYSLSVCSAALSALGRSAIALELAGLGSELCRQAGVDLPPGWRERLEAALDPARRELGPRASVHERVGALSDPASVIEQMAGELAGRASLPAQSLAIEALGDFRLLRAGRTIELAPQPARLVKLVVSAGRSLHLEEVIDALWPEADLRTGRTRLRNLLSRVNRSAGRVLVREGETVRLAREVVVDADRFEIAARQALDTLASGDSQSSLRAARAAAELYRGDLFAEEPYEPWVHARREGLRRLMLRLLDSAAEAAQVAGEIEETEVLLRMAIEIDPLNEARYVLLGRLLASLHRPAAALQVIEQARAATGELSIPLAEPLAELEEVLRRGAGVPATR